MVDLVVHGRVGGSELKRKRSQPSRRGLSSKLCCLSSVLLLGACVLAAFFPLLLIVVCESDDDRLQTSRVKMSWASKVVREGVLVGQFSARRGM